MTSARASGTGLSSPTEPQSSQGLGPSGFDPSRGELDLMICARVAASSIYDGPTCEALNNAILDGKKDSIGLVQAARAALIFAVFAKGIFQDIDALTGCADDQTLADCDVGELRAVARKLLRDSDGSPQGGDACGSVHDSAGPQDIAQTEPSS